MLFYITGGAPQAVPGTACVEANRTACTEIYCSSVYNLPRLLCRVSHSAKTSPSILQATKQLCPVVCVRHCLLGRQKLLNIRLTVEN
jgi:hypothetical protein